MARDRRLSARATAAAYIEAARRNPDTAHASDVVLGTRLAAYERDLGCLAKAVARVVVTPSRRPGAEEEWRRRGVAMRQACARVLQSRSLASNVAHPLLMADVEAGFMLGLTYWLRASISEQASRGTGYPEDIESAL